MSRARELSQLANENALSVNDTTLEVGINSTSPDSDLNVGGAIKMDGPSGVITATSYEGSGANLTGIAATDTIAAASLTVSGISTFTGKVSCASSITLADGMTKGVYLGDSEDLALYHNGSNSFLVDRGTGPLYVRGNNAVRIEKYVNDTTGEEILIGNADGSVDAYYAGTKRFETTPTGAVITGIATATTQLEVGSIIQAEAASGIVTATAFVPTEGQLGNRNIIYNGAMQIAQRGTSLADCGWEQVFVCDRWKLGGTSSGRLTMSQTADAPVGFAKCLKLDCTTADTSIAANEYLTIAHAFEGHDLQRIGNGLVGAKEITISFYVKASGAFTFGFELYNADNARHNCRLFNTTTSWVRHTFVIQADEDDGSSPYGDDNQPSLYFQFWLHAGSNSNSGTLATNWANYVAANRAAGIDSFYSSTSNELFITGVQIEVGSVATPFEHRSYGQELARCQRYYYRNSGNKVVLFSDYNNSTTNFWAGMYLPVTMRAAPTATVTTIAAGALTSTSTSIDMLSFQASSGNTHFDNNTVIEATADL